MSSRGKYFYEFGPYRVDPEKRVLLRRNRPVPLQPKAFETLLVLVQQGEGVVSKDELMNRVWAGTFVEESNLAQTIFVLRKALGESDSEQPYILTVPGRGYGLAQKVRVVAAEEREGVAWSKIACAPRGLIENGPLTAPALEAGPKRRRMVAKAFAVLAVLGLTTYAAVVLRPTVAPPKVLRIRQITHMGTLISNTKLVTDGPRIYFRAWDGRDRVIRYVSAAGGLANPVYRAFANLDIDDISADGSAFLVVELNSRADAEPLWWVPVSLGSPQPVGTVRTQEARCSPDGRIIAYTVGPDLFLADHDGSNPRKFTTLPGPAIYLQWSPDSRRLRFAVIDPRTGDTSLWEGNLATNTARPILTNWAGSRHATPGGWMPDGRYFFFTSVGDETSDIWAIRESKEFFRRTNPEPIQITTGPLNFYQPTPSKGGRSVFAVGEQFRGETFRYGAESRRFGPYAQGLAADEVAFSRDGLWMAYVEFPEGVLVRSRADGSDPRQLTFAPMRAFNPQWSPDGSQLAFDAAAQPGAPRKIYILPRDGGVPALAAPGVHGRQLYPSWSSQGKSIVFTSFDANGQNSALYVVAPGSRHVALLPGTAGLRLGQVSPDGSKIVALADQELTLYDTTSHRILALAKLADFPRWSPDGTYVCFRTPYFGGFVEHPGTYRWMVSTNKIEKLASDPDFRLTGVDGVWSGLAPDGSVLLVRDLGTSDLYRLDVELP